MRCRERARRDRTASRLTPSVRLPESVSFGEPDGFLLSYEDYQRITGQRRNIVEALSMPGLVDGELEIPRSRELPRPADLS